MAWRLNSGDIAGFKILFSLGILYGLISVLVYSIIHMKFITPLPMDAPPDRFSEARAIQHVRVLSKDIGGRQEGRQGLRLAAQYIKTQLEMMKERAQPGIRIEIEETIVNGSFNMFFLRHSISLAYRNHTNIIMRISSVDSGENDSAVLVNGHFDTPPGSPGAGDCGSCVASMLELARLSVDSGWIPPRPVIFLFNGAEELFMLGSHGFITTHRWNETIGAFIDVEASGTGGLGYFIPDVIVAAIIGLVTSWSVGPILPVVSHWLARSSILHFLLHSSILALALSSQFFPYSADAPKRVIFQHTIRNAGPSKIMETTYDFAVVDSNTLPFVFKHAPEVADTLHINTELSFDAVKQSHQEDWMGIFPISSLFTRCMKFPAKRSDVSAEYNHFPHLTTNKPQESLSGGSRRIYLEFSLGSLKEVWVAVLNITGSLSSWSFADNVLPVPEKTGNGPPSYICRLSGAGDKKWTFWLEANSSEAIKVDMAVVDQYLIESAAKLKVLFPDWIDVTAFSSFMSTYVF